jgi:hypothetical protein
MRGGWTKFVSCDAAQAAGEPVGYDRMDRVGLRRPRDQRARFGRLALAVCILMAIDRAHSLGSH